jgi:hypothetical protein
MSPPKYWGPDLDRMMATGFAAPRIRARLTKGERVRMAVLALMPA